MRVIVLNLSKEPNYGYHPCLGAYLAIVNLKTKAASEAVYEFNPVFPSSIIDNKEAQDKLLFTEFFNNFRKFLDKSEAKLIITSNKKKLMTILDFYYRKLFPSSFRKFYRNRSLIDRILIEKRIYVSQKELHTNPPEPPFMAREIITGKKLVKLLLNSKYFEKEKIIDFAGKKVFIYKDFDFDRISFFFPPMVPEHPEVKLEEKISTPSFNTVEEWKKIDNAKRYNTKEPPQALLLNNNGKTEQQVKEDENSKNEVQKVQVQEINGETKNTKENVEEDLPDIEIEEKEEKKVNTEVDNTKFNSTLKEEPLSPLNPPFHLSGKTERERLAPAADEFLRGRPSTSPKEPASITYKKASTSILSELFYVMSFYAEIPIVNFLGYKTVFERDFFFPFTVKYFKVKPYLEDYYRLIPAIECNRKVLIHDDKEVLMEGFFVLYDEIEKNFSISLIQEEKERLFILMATASFILAKLRDLGVNVTKEEENLNRFYTGVNFVVEEVFPHFFLKTDRKGSLAKKKITEVLPAEYFSLEEKFYFSSYSFYSKIFKKFTRQYWQEKLAETENVLKVYLEMLYRIVEEEEKDEERREKERFLNTVEEMFNPVLADVLYPYQLTVIRM